jgi:hypothetical protein
MLAEASMRSSVPAPPELVLIETVVAAAFFATTWWLGGYFSTVTRFGDNAEYAAIARAIHEGVFLHVPAKLPWGMPYAIVMVAYVCRVSEYVALVVVSSLASVSSVLLAGRLWGGWIASFFAVLSIPWLQRSFLGGSEPLFVLLVFGSFFMARQERWLVAALLASVATIVRPVGLIAVGSLGLVLVYRRLFRELAAIGVVAALVALTYVVPQWMFLGDPLASYHGYRVDWDSTFPLGVPFRALITGFRRTTRSFANVMNNIAWICLALGGVIGLMRRSSRGSVRHWPMEIVFCVAYVVFLVCYNSTTWSFAEFARFAIPVIPLLLIGCERYLPRHRAVIYGLAIGVPIAAAARGMYGVSLP